MLDIAFMWLAFQKSGWIKLQEVATKVQNHTDVEYGRYLWVNCGQDHENSGARSTVTNHIQSCSISRALIQTMGKLTVDSIKGLWYSVEEGELGPALRPTIKSMDTGKEMEAKSRVTNQIRNVQNDSSMWNSVLALWHLQLWTPLLGNLLDLFWALIYFLLFRDNLRFRPWIEMISQHLHWLVLLNHIFDQLSVVLSTRFFLRHSKITQLIIFKY